MTRISSRDDWAQRMALSTKLELRQGQQLVMTPQLQQAIRLLQLSNIELMQYVETELERNPLLERTKAPSARCAPRAGNAEFTKPEEAAACERDRLRRPRQARRRSEGTFDTEYDNVYPDSAAIRSAPTGSDASGWAIAAPAQPPARGDDVNIEAFVANDVSLREHLAEQLPLVLKDPAERLIGQYLIDMVDEAGYLPAPTSPRSPRSSVRRRSWSRRCWRSLQTLDPPGVFARSLAECLALQLKEQNRYDPRSSAASSTTCTCSAGHNFAGAAQGGRRRDATSCWR